MQFLGEPSPQSWYRAHNTSIASAYLEYRSLSEIELPAERFFMDVTLARVLLMHSVSLHPRSALGPFFWPLGRILGDPRSRTVDAYLSLRNVLPDKYPITGLSIIDILDGENFLGRLLDYGILLPRAQLLYEFAASDLEEPCLRDFIESGDPIYAWPYDERDAWKRRKSRRLSALLAHLTAPA